MHEQIAETQISLDFDTVWPGSLLSAWMNVPADLSLFACKPFYWFVLRFMIFLFFYFFLNDNSNDKNYEINNANALCEYMIILNVLIGQPISLRNHVFKKLFRNEIRAPNSLDPDQVPYFVRPDLGQNV